jgi:NAD-dependent deacetylase
MDCSDIAREISSSRYAVAFTGAGVSTPSGIPDFRGKGGLWKRFSPEIATKEYFLSNPKGFWEFYYERVTSLVNASPNTIHYSLAQMEESGLIKAIITQNVDGLHRMAGSKEVIELHGNIRNFYCFSCGLNYSLEQVLVKIRERGLPPMCSCGGIIRPDVVLFGEKVKGFDRALRVALSSDLLLSLGSSLTVRPASLIPETVKSSGGKLIIVNLDETPLDEIADISIRARVEEVMDCVLKELGFRKYY